MSKDLLVLFMALLHHVVQLMGSVVRVQVIVALMKAVKLNLDSSLGDHRLSFVSS